MFKKIFLAAIPAALGASLLLSTAALADTQETLVIKDFVGTVTITTGDDFSVSGKKGDITEIRQDGLIIDGNEVIDSSSCKNVNGNIELSFGKKSWFKRIGGYKDLDEYPNLDITVPEGAYLEIYDSVIFGTGETFGSVDAAIKSCGSLEIGDISGPLTLKVSGSGDFSAGQVATANVRISGSGDVELGDMGAAVLKVTGSGDLNAGSVSGPAKVTTTGSGDIELTDINGDLVFEGRGSSDFSADSVTGRVSISTTGSGNVDISGGDVSELMITATGSSEVDFGGAAGDVTISARGSSNIDVDEASGEVEVKTSGSADVRIDGKRYDD